MGIVTSLHRVSDDQLSEFISDTTGLEEFLSTVDRDGPTGYLDKSIDEIQALLTAGGVQVWIAPIEMPGEPIHFGRGRICFGLSAGKVAEIDSRLRATTFEALASHTDADANTDYLRVNYENLTRFVHHAVSRGLGAILTHD